VQEGVQALGNRQRRPRKRHTGNGQNAGTITIKSGGKTLGNGGNQSGGNGQTIIEAGGVASIMVDNGGTPLEIPQVGNAGTNPLPILQLDEGSTLTLKTSQYILSGPATMNGLLGTGGVPGDSAGNFMVGEVASVNRKLTLKADGVLNINGTAESNRILAVVVDGGQPGIVGEAGARIVLGQYGYIDIYAAGGAAYDGDTSSLDHNFYDSNNNKVTGNSLHNTTYTWTENIGGVSGADGWKAGA
jgi:hypothetical protein